MSHNNGVDVGFSGITNIVCSAHKVGRGEGGGGGVWGCVDKGHAYSGVLLAWEFAVGVRWLKLYIVIVTLTATDASQSLGN